MAKALAVQERQAMRLRSRDQSRGPKDDLDFESEALLAAAASAGDAGDAEPPAATCEMPLTFAQGVSRITLSATAAWPMAHGRAVALRETLFSFPAKPVMAHTYLQLVTRGAAGRDRLRRRRC